MEHLMEHVSDLHAKETSSFSLQNTADINAGIWAIQQLLDGQEDDEVLHDFIQNIELKTLLGDSLTESESDVLISALEPLRADLLEWLPAWGVNEVTPADTQKVWTTITIGNANIAESPDEYREDILKARESFLSFIGYSNSDIEKFRTLRQSVSLPRPINLIDSSRFLSKFGGSPRKLYARAPGLVFSNGATVKDNIMLLVGFGANPKTLVNEAGAAVQNIGRSLETAEFLKNSNLEKLTYQAPILLEMDVDHIQARLLAFEQQGFDIKVVATEAPRLVANKPETIAHKLRTVRAGARLLCLPQDDVMQAIYDKPNTVRSMSAVRIRSIINLIARGSTQEEWAEMKDDFEARGLNPYRAIMRILCDCPLELLEQRVEQAKDSKGVLTIARDLKNELQNNRARKRT